jgi:protein phosphatase
VGLRIAEHASLTDVGRQRHTNEDFYYDEPPVFAVADGMGGAQAGEVASAMAVDEFSADRDAAATLEQQLEAIARAANRKIWDMSQSDSRHAGMGTTLTAVMVGNREVAVGHVGDSRLYRQRNGTLERLTRDHSLVEEFVRQGRLTPEQAEKHPQRSVITRALGPEADVEVDTFTVPARAGDLYLLCSDGLSGMVSEEAMQRILSDRRPLVETAKQLIETANSNGGKDNITAVLFRLEDDGAPDAPGTPTESYETIAGDVQAPSTEEIEGARSRQDAEPAARSRAEPAVAERPGSTPSAPPRPTAPEPPVAGPATSLRRAPSRRRRVYARAATALAVLLLALGGGLYALVKNVWFIGTNSDAAVTLYRGLPYDLPMGVHLYEQRYVSGVPALSLPPRRRKRVLDHQLRSRGDAVDLIRSLDPAATR